MFVEALLSHLGSFDAVSNVPRQTESEDIGRASEPTQPIKTPKRVRKSQLKNKMAILKELNRKRSAEDDERGQMPRKMLLCAPNSVARFIVYVLFYRRDFARKILKFRVKKETQIELENSSCLFNSLPKSVLGYRNAKGLDFHFQLDHVKGHSFFLDYLHEKDRLAKQIIKPKQKSFYKTHPDTMRIHGFHLIHSLQLFYAQLLEDSNRIVDCSPIFECLLDLVDGSRLVGQSDFPPLDFLSVFFKILNFGFRTCHKVSGLTRSHSNRISSTTTKLDRKTSTLSRAIFVSLSLTLRPKRDSHRKRPNSPASVSRPVAELWKRPWFRPSSSKMTSSR